MGQETWPQLPGGIKSQQGHRTAFPGGRWAGWGRAWNSFPGLLCFVTVLNTLFRRAVSFLLCPGCSSSLSAG